MAPPPERRLYIAARVHRGNGPGTVCESRVNEADVTGSVDGEEVARFAATAAEWWNPRGPYAPLHKLTPARIEYVRNHLAAHFGRDATSLNCLNGLSILDVGCGGGILAEPLARLGARVSGIEPAEESVAVARAHASVSGLDISYQALAAEDLLQDGERFDAVIASEVIEHVHDVPGFVRTLAALAKPGGMVFISTLNRTAKSYALAIVGAEYVLRWVPAGTHSWRKFVTPAELTGHFRAAGLLPDHPTGMVYNPLRDAWSLSPDHSVNYWMSAAKA
jgi:2-polyprenyl-6-hydroxyphenyl methylase / 3-demethylubiquinone-9 3-methyltransferase